MLMRREYPLSWEIQKLVRVRQPDHNDDAIHRVDYEKGCDLNFGMEVSGSGFPS